jgi:serine/threonine protein kinase
VAPACFLALSIEDNDFRRFSMAEKPARQEETIFYQALEKDPADREAYLKEACGDKHELYKRVDALLRAYDTDDSLHHVQPVHPHITLENPNLTEVPGSVIGRYKLLERIGEGGFGEVWAAEQKKPVKRRVALKIIKLGMDTKQVVARFEAERQALAMMDHPNIAKVLDAGATDTGRPYFVMELVKGIPIMLTRRESFTGTSNPPTS